MATGYQQYYESRLAASGLLSVIPSGFGQSLYQLEMIGAGFVMLVGYLFISQWIRITVFVVGALVWLNVLQIAGPAISLVPDTASNSTATAPAANANTGSTSAAATGDLPAQTAPPDSKNLAAYLDAFYASENSAKLSSQRRYQRMLNPLIY